MPETIEVLQLGWIAETETPVLVDTVPRTVLQVRFHGNRLTVEEGDLNSVNVRFYKPATGWDGFVAYYALTCQQPAVGVRSLLVQTYDGSRKVSASQDIPAQLKPAAQAQQILKAPSLWRSGPFWDRDPFRTYALGVKMEQRRVVKPKEPDHFPIPEWICGGSGGRDPRYIFLPGEALGIVVWSSHPTLCEVKAGGW